MIGIIGGSGLDDPKLLKDFQEKEIETPYGKPSSPIALGKIAGTEVAIIARHGKGHSIMPSNVNYRANIWALKELGVKVVLASTAVGSLKEDIKPGDLVFLDQFIDRTTKRHTSFYDQDKVCHISLAEPFCTDIRGILVEIAREMGLRFHEKGTVVTIEGPRFSTKAESQMFRSWGADVINMSVATEATLAREAGLCYAAVAMSTDYDCWHESEEPVTIEMVLSTMKKNADNVKQLFLKAVERIDHGKACDCKTAIDSALI